MSAHREITRYNLDRRQIANSRKPERVLRPEVADRGRNFRVAGHTPTEQTFKSGSTMLRMSLWPLRVLLCYSFLSGVSSAQSVPSRLPHKFALAQFEDIRCRAKRRLQDCSFGSPITSQVLAGGKMVDSRVDLATH